MLTTKDGVTTLLKQSESYAYYGKNDPAGSRQTERSALWDVMTHIVLATIRHDLGVPDRIEVTKRVQMLDMDIQVRFIWEDDTSVT